MTGLPFYKTAHKNVYIQPADLEKNKTNRFLKLCMNNHEPVLSVKKRIQVVLSLVQLNRFLNLEMSADQRMTWFISTICQVASLTAMKIISNKVSSPRTVIWFKMPYVHSLHFCTGWTKRRRTVSNIKREAVLDAVWSGLSVLFLVNPACRTLQSTDVKHHSCLTIFKRQVNIWIYALRVSALDRVHFQWFYLSAKGYRVTKMHGEGAHCQFIMHVLFSKIF